MLLRMIYDDRLAQAAYLIGCQRTGEAIVIDPERDIDRYVRVAEKEGLKIVAAAETHIHADFLSGSREFAERGVKVYLSDEGGPDWTYQWLNKRSGGGVYDHRLLKDGDTFKIGNIEFKAVHTPGHTPEHIMFMVTDRGGGADEPMGIATGDFVFVGDLGRPDLLESAAGVQGAKDPSARTLYRSVKRFMELPGYVQVWPAHGAGSACGKALGAVPQTTVGYEQRFNPAIKAASSEQSFVDFILAGQPEPPLYFARMKRDNKMGPKLLGALPAPPRLTAAELLKLDGRTTAIVDTRPWKAFRTGHVPNALFAPLDSMFAMVVGSYVTEDEPIVLVVEERRLEETVRDLVRIGLDRVVGWFAANDLEAYESDGGRLVPTAEIDVAAAEERIQSRRAMVLDVRRADEFAEGHIAGAVNVAYPRLAEHLGEIPRDRHIIVNCRGGGRSARACAYLQRQGYEVANVAGGYLAWEQAHEPAHA
ncbi:MAG: MBL fold metallo-hydrolase [Phycisphaerales bacterium]|nr:MBL fold metallo-hydrolase [Phycisphaerales bacterium]